MIVIIYYVLFIFCLIYSAYFAITGLWGFKEMHKSIIKKHKAKYKIAVLKCFSLYYHFYCRPS